MGTLSELLAAFGSGAWDLWQNVLGGNGRGRCVCGPRVQAKRATTAGPGPGWRKCNAYRQTGLGCPPVALWL